MTRPMTLSVTRLQAQAGVLIALTLATLLTEVSGETGVWRLALTTAFVITVPGWAIVAYARSASPAFVWSVGIAVSIAIGIVVGQGLVLVHAWHPVPAVVVLGLLALPVLAHHVWRNR